MMHSMKEEYKVYKSTIILHMEIRWMVSIDKIWNDVSRNVGRRMPEH